MSTGAGAGDERVAEHHGTVRLEQSYGTAFGAYVRFFGVLGVMVIGGTGLAMTYLVGGDTGTGLFVLAAALSLPAMFALPGTPLRGLLVDSTKVSRLVSLDRATGDVERRGVFGAQTTVSVVDLTDASLGTWHGENGTLVLGFGEVEVVLRTGEIPEVEMFVDELRRAQQRFGSQVPVRLTIGPRDRDVDERTAAARQAHRHALWLAVDDRLLSTEAEIAAADPVHRVSLLQSARDLYALPIQVGTAVALSIGVAILQMWSRPASEQVAAAAIAGVLVVGIALLFIPLALNTRRLTVDLTTGEVTAVRVRRPRSLGSIADGFTATQVRSPFRATQLVIDFRDGRARLRGDVNRSVDRWLELTSTAAARFGGEVTVDLDTTRPRKLEPTSTRREPWTLTITAPETAAGS